ncbi:phage head spike fiber domain-containing protein [Limosilactobacillus reuteri]|uniref:phage head spike fiber domain-containing protein n=1 Tax=Limosilactobacillus reuteri TaxID=1598 RepID=UPI001E59961A|nr:phage specificity protein [Limosilactobacillus reuteri]MCC4466842.1 phage specificity protein [Limosilactobacillus reuteri]MCC4472912.1 phage specificity protein [Limosilactobacillus reuteri]
MEKTIKYLENGEYHYATVRSVGDLANLKTTSKETLVEAINELWDGGGNSDPSKAPKPEGYDQLVQDVADTVSNIQQINQEWVQWQADDQAIEAEKKESYQKAMKEMQEAIDKAKADAEALSQKTSELDDQITKTFSDLDTNIDNLHKQLEDDNERLTNSLETTKTDLESAKKDLQNVQLDNGNIHDDIVNLQGKFDRKIWNTDLDPLKEQINQNSTEGQQTKDQLLEKADRKSLDTLTGTVEALDTQVKKTADGVEMSVKKSELGGEIAEALVNKTNLLLGTRRFTTNNWKQRENVTIQADPWKGMKVAKQTSPTEGIQQSYDVKAGTTYVFSLYAKVDEVEDGVSPQITLAPNALDTSLDTKIDVWRKEIDDITSDFQRYDLTFTPSEDCTIYPHVISNSNNPIFVCGYQLEIGKTSTPWEPNQEDVGDYVENSEAQFNVYNDKIQALTEKQRQQGDTQEKLKTEVTQTAEGTKQVSEQLKVTNGDVDKLRGQIDATASHLKTEYEEYTNKAVGQISDSTLNLIRNSSFMNKDDNFNQWQNVSAKANIREDDNGLRWVELTQSGQTTDNIIGLTSNYFNIKQGKVTIAVDIKLGDKAELDSESVLTLELYDENKKRVDFTRLTINDLGLNKSLLRDHQVHRGIYRLGIDRNDAKYMTVKALLARNGDLFFTNFSARLSSIDDGAYEPNPDDLNQQILKQNTKIEQNAKEVAIKANSVDVTRDIKNAVDGIQVGTSNLLHHTDTFEGWHKGTSVNISNDKYLNGSVAILNNFGSGVNALDSVLDVTNDEKYITWTVYAKADNAGDKLHTELWGGGGYTDQPLTTKWQRYKFAGNHADSNRNFYLWGVNSNKGKVYVALPYAVVGNTIGTWNPAPKDVSEEIKSAKDAAIKVASDQINIHVNELSTSFDDKLNKRVNEVKTASEKFTSDGIEQVVTKVTEVKNYVNGVNSKVDNLQIGGRNLLIGTSEDELSGKAYAFADYQISGGLQPNKTYTLSGWARVDQNSLNHHQNVFIDVYSEDWSWSATLNISSSLTSQYNKITFTTPSGKQFHPYVTAYLSHPDGGTNENNNDAISGKAYIKKLKLEEGNFATDYTHAPEDINRKIDTQTLDSANIDNMRTQGHYFVRNLTGNPIGGWVYVDVTGNNNDRIRQDVYQDNGGKHMYRRLFGNSWSDWEQGAYLSDVNNVKTEVTASVKNLGDRVTTEVNSITSKVDNMKIGGRNLLKGTRDFNSKYWYQSGDHTALADNPIDTSTKEIHSWLDWHSFKNNQTIQLDPSKNYMISADIAIYDGDGNGLYVTPYGTVDGQGGNLAGTDVNLAGFPRQVKGEGFRRIYLPVTAHGRTLKDFRIEGHGNWNAGSGSVFISKIALYEGNTPLAWSDSSDDFVEAIKEVNTKWDVANGQIQGKVTETQVNNILNGKGYATQSWAQTMFQMKSDSITLQAVRDNITNGIQNQVNVINKKIDTQTLDSANIDNMRTQGHYFVKNLTGNPIGGWVYVDVNYADQWRIRQDVYQDVGGRHVYRRLNGSSWTEWTTDVNNKNVVSQINITPDQIKIASNKIVIDGNTDIHGKLNVPEVELQGKSGVIGLNGSKGILIASRNGDTIGEFQTRITKFGMDLLTSTNNRKEVMGGITTGYNTNNNNFNGISIVLDTQQKLGAPHGGDFFSIGNTTWSDLEGNRTWNKAMDYDASQQIHGGGFGWYEHSTLYGDGRRISVDGAHDPLWLSGTKFSSSSQPDLFQPTIRAGWSDQVYGDSGIGFLWNQLKPFGNVDVSDVREIWFNGIKFIFGWASHPNMWNNAKQPAFYRVGDDGSVTAGIAFTPGSTWDLGSGARNITQGLMVLQNHGWM